MPNAKKAAFAIHLSESGVTLHEKFGERADRCGLCRFRIIQDRLILQKPSAPEHSTRKETTLVLMAVLNFAVAIRKPEGARPELDTQFVVEPFGEKIDAGFVVAPDISSDV